MCDSKDKVWLDQLHPGLPLCLSLLECLLQRQAYLWGKKLGNARAGKAAFRPVWMLESGEGVSLRLQLSVKPRLSTSPMHLFLILNQFIHS